jgi:hypothetical protein
VIRMGRRVSVVPLRRRPFIAAQVQMHNQCSCRPATGPSAFPCRLSGFDCVRLPDAPQVSDHGRTPHVGPLPSDRCGSFRDGEAWSPFFDRRLPSSGGSGCAAGSDLIALGVVAQRLVPTSRCCSFRKRLPQNRGPSGRAAKEQTI